MNKYIKMNVMFSRKTIFMVFKALNFKTHNEVEQFILEFELEGIASGQTMKDKEMSIARYLIDNPKVLGSNNSILSIEIIEYTIDHCAEYRLTDLLHSLDKDGFKLISGKLQKIIPAEFPVVAQENQLIALLDKFSFTTAKGHYKQALAAHTRGEWAGANAQLRTFVEEFFNNTLSIIDSDKKGLTSNQIKIELAKSGFFIKDYNEFLNGTGFVEGFWKRLHPAGSHPGLSEQVDSTFRLHLVILVIHYFLTRLDAIYDAGQYSHS